MDETLPTGELDRPELPKIIHAIAGVEADKQEQDWVEQNIITITNATKNGRHDTLLYPASGSDILRPLYAYGVNHLIAIDTSRFVLPQILETLDTSGLPYTIKDLDETSKQISIVLEGNTRLITLMDTDAREVMADMRGKTVDILHVYLPTGADSDQTELEFYLQKKYGESWREKEYDPDVVAELSKDTDSPKIDPETGKYRITREGIKNRLSLENYKLISEGGFLVFDEQRIANNVPDSLLAISGLTEHRIVRRHPLTVTTSWYPTPDELAQMDRVGYIYQKTKSVSDEVVECVTEALSNEDYLSYQLMEISRGNFEYIDLEDDDLDISGAFRGFIAGIQQSTEEIATKMRSTGVDEEIIKTYKQGKATDLQRKLNDLQTTYRSFISTFDSLVEKIESREITQEEAIAELGITEHDGRRGSKKYPMSIKYLRQGIRQEYTRDIYQKFVDMDMDELFKA